MDSEGWSNAVLRIAEHKSLPISHQKRMTTLGALGEKVLLHLISLDRTFLSSSKTNH